MLVKTKLILSFAIIIAVFAGAVILDFYVTRSEMIENTAQNAITLSKNIGDGIDQSVHNSLNDLRIIAVQPGVINFVVESNREFEKIGDIESYLTEKDTEWLSFAGKENPVFNELIKNPISQRLESFRQEFRESHNIDIFPELFVTNKYGATIAENQRTTDWDQSDELPFQNSKKQGWYVSDLYFDESAGVWALEVAVAIKDGDEFIGMIKTALAIEDISQTLLDSKEGVPYNDFRLFLFTADDRYVYSDDPKVGSLGDDAHAFIGYELHSTEEGHYTIPVFGINRLTAWSTLDGYRDFPGLNWMLVISIPEQEFLGPIDDLQTIVIGILLSSVAVATVTSILMIKSVIEPIKKVKEAAQKISEGNFDTKVEVKSNDEIGELSAMINETADKLKDAQLKKDEFASMITHELKTPLVPIRGFCEMLKDHRMGELNKDQKEAVDEIYNNTNELHHIIQNVLNAQKIGLDKLTFNIQDISLDEFMEGRYKNLVSLMNEKGIKFVSSTKKGLIVKGDISKLSEIFTNLVQNAADFVSDKGGRIEIGAKDQGNDVLFYVKDNGIGIPKAKMGNLFKKFYQIDTSYTRKHGGSGLGLSICKGYIEGMDGKIWVESELGLGSTFYFTLPNPSKKITFDDYEKSYVDRYMIKKEKRKAKSKLKKERN